MFEQPSEWPAYGPHKTVLGFDNSISYPAEDHFQHDFYVTDTDQQVLPNSPKLFYWSPQNPTLGARGAIAQLGCAPHMTVRHSTIHRPTPRYPPGYNHGIDHPRLADGHPTPDSSTTDTTPALTDSWSESLYSPSADAIFISELVQHENISPGAQPLLEPQAPYFSTYFSPGILSEDDSIQSVQEARAQVSESYQHPSIHVMEYPTLVTHVVPLKFSRESYNTLLHACGPVSREIKIPSDGSPYSFVVLDRRGCHPVISITETGGELSDITVDLNGTVTILTKHNFCRVPGCGYWSKNGGRVPRHRLTHFKDRGFECQNPFRRGANVPKHMQCQLGPGQYLTRLDLFKKHSRAPSCQGYAPSFTQDSQRSFWRGPDNVDELYLLPFTRDVHVPFILRAPKS